MRFFAVVGLLAASTSWAQQPVANSQQSPSQVQPQTPAAGQQQTIVIPAGTRIPAKLVSPVTAKSGRPGDAVRAVTAFPVTVDTQLAIPVGTYIEGVIDKVNRRGPSGPVLLMHFTRILYGNGYGVSVDATSTQAKVIGPRRSSPTSSESPVTLASLWNSSLVLNQMPAQTSLPPLQPPPAPPSHMGALVGVAVASAVSVIVLVVLAAKHGGGNGVLFDTGWQFEMVLQSPLSVDVASIAAAVDASSAQ